MDIEYGYSFGSESFSREIDANPTDQTIFEQQELIGIQAIEYAYEIDEKNVDEIYKAIKEKDVALLTERFQTLQKENGLIEDQCLYLALIQHVGCTELWVQEIYDDLYSQLTDQKKQLLRMSLKMYMMGK